MGQVRANVLRTRRNERLHLCRGKRRDLRNFRGAGRDDVAPRVDEIADRGGRDWSRRTGPRPPRNDSSDGNGGRSSVPRARATTSFNPPGTLNCVLRLRGREQRIQQLRGAQHRPPARGHRPLHRHHPRAGQPDDMCGRHARDIPARHQRQQLADDGDSFVRPKLNPRRCQISQRDGCIWSVHRRAPVRHPCQPGNGAKQAEKSRGTRRMLSAGVTAERWRGQLFHQITQPEHTRWELSAHLDVSG